MTSRSLSTSLDKPNLFFQKKRQKTSSFSALHPTKLLPQAPPNDHKSRPRPFLDDIATATARDSFHGPWHGGF